MEIEIWMEGYAATGERQGAQKIGEYFAKNFDEAIEMYKKEHPTTHGIERKERKRFINQEAYDKRDAEYEIWACSLYDNEKDARKSFG